VHLRREGRVWHPLVGGTWGSLLQHLVNLLQGQALGLGDEEVGEGEGDAAKGTPHEEDLSTEVGLSLLGSDQVGGDDTDDLEIKLVFVSLFVSFHKCDLRSSRTS
jgi:hypothetical protein